VRHVWRVARVGDQLRESVGDPELPLDRAEQHDTTVGSDPSAVESGHHLLALHAREAERGSVWGAEWD
jgi:hypothetical protein